MQVVLSVIGSQCIGFAIEFEFGIAYTIAITANDGAEI